MLDYIHLWHTFWLNDLYIKKKQNRCGQTLLSIYCTLYFIGLESYHKCDRVGVNYGYIILEIDRNLHRCLSFTGWVFRICTDAVASNKKVQIINWSKYNCWLWQPTSSHNFLMIATLAHAFTSGMRDLVERLREEFFLRVYISIENVTLCLWEDCFPSNIISVRQTCNHVYLFGSRVAATSRAPLHPSAAPLW